MNPFPSDKTAIRFHNLRCVDPRTCRGERVNACSERDAQGILRQFLPIELEFERRLEIFFYGRCRTKRKVVGARF